MLRKRGVKALEKMAEKSQKVLFQVDIFPSVIHNNNLEGSFDLGDH